MKTTINKPDENIIAVISPDGEVVFSNSEFIKLTKDFNVDNFSVLFGSEVENPPSDFPGLLKVLMKKINISLNKGIETRFDYSEPESKEVGYNFFCYPVIDSDKKIVCAVLLGIKTEVQIADSKRQGFLFSAAFFYHFACDNELNITSAVTNTQLDTEHLNSRNISEFIPGKLVGKISEKLKSFEPGIKFIQFKYDFVISDRSVNADIKLLKNSKGVTIIMEDLTDPISKDDELRKYVEELHYSKIISEQYAKELTLVNKKLNESEEELKIINADKDKFFSIVAHDLRSPFSSLLGFSDFLSKEAANLSVNEVQTYAKSIFTTGRHILSLLENLLQWSRVQLGRIEFTPEVYNLTEQLNSLYEYFEHISAGKNVTITLKSNEKMTVYADRNMIETAIRNLLSNSVKFTGDGGSIQLSAVRKKGYIEIRVKDNGVGMSQEVQKKLFRIDSQHSTLGTRNEKGSGLGLLICKEFIEKNNGEISVVSQLGKGTVFTIRIPQGKTPGKNPDSGKGIKAQKSSGYQFSK